MFRAQQNAFDDVVGKLRQKPHLGLGLTSSAAKATDENLTSENWEYILDVCDKVSSSDSGSKDVVAAMIKRLAHRNANVQLYTLELANSLSQNCGIDMHRELASRSFTDALLRLANDRVGRPGLRWRHSIWVTDRRSEHTSTSQVEDFGTYGVLDHGFLEQHRAGYYGAGIREIEGPECAARSTH